MQNICPHTQGSRQSGLSLIELMIALVVGLILMAGVVSIFLSSRKSYGINSAVGRIQENARAAMNFIRHDVRMAGYMGCGTSDSELVNQINSPARTTLPYNFNNAITGFEYNNTAPTDNYTITSETPPAVGAASWTPSLDPSLPTGGAGYAIPGSDIFAVSLSQGTIAPSSVSSIPTGGDSLTLTANNNGLAAGDLLIVSNCVYTAVRQATSMTGRTIAMDTGTNAPGNTSHLAAALAQGAQVTIARVVAFYVGTSVDGSPALYEATTYTPNANGFRSEEIVPGVENMQVLYGMAASINDQTPSQYVTADKVTNWNSVISVRVALLLRSATGAVPMPAAAQPYNLLGTTVQVPRDTRLRQVFTATIGLRNRTLRP